MADKEATGNGKTARLDMNAHKIIEDIKKTLKGEGVARPDTSDAIRKLAAGNRLADDLCTILVNYAGETGKNEGAVQTLQRLVDEVKLVRSK